MTDQLRQIVADVLDLPLAEVTDELGPAVTHLWDSLGHLRIVTAIEDELGIQFTMEEIQSIDGFAKLRGMVSAKRG